MWNDSASVKDAVTQETRRVLYRLNEIRGYLIPGSGLHVAILRLGCILLTPIWSVVFPATWNTSIEPSYNPVDMYRVLSVQSIGWVVGSWISRERAPEYPKPTYCIFYLLLILFKVKVCTIIRLSWRQLRVALLLNVQLSKFPLHCQILEVKYCSYRPDHCHRSDVNTSVI